MSNHFPWQTQFFPQSMRFSTARPERNQLKTLGTMAHWRNFEVSLSFLNVYFCNICLFQKQLIILSIFRNSSKHGAASQGIFSQRTSWGCNSGNERKGDTAVRRSWSITGSAWNLIQGGARIINDCFWFP